jgi:predicted ArsR family transcriptional regulator
MLEKLLERISKGGSYSAQSLSRELGVSKELVEAMLSDLCRAGYLQRVDGCSENQCAGCGTASACHPKGKVWLLGRRQGSEEP